MKILLFVFFSFFSYSNSDIEGGKKSNDPKYKHFIKLSPKLKRKKDTKKGNSFYKNFERLSNCSGTRISYNKILTAAHCLLNIKPYPFEYFYARGDKVSASNELDKFKFDGYGEVNKVYVHPLYRKFALQRKRLQNIEKRLPEEEYERKFHNFTVNMTLYDIGFIELKNIKKTNENYPKIINDTLKLKDAIKLELYGYGDSSLSIKKNKIFLGKAPTTIENGILGKNQWIQCKPDYKNRSVDDILKLAKKLTYNRHTQNTITHKIINNKETQVHSKSSLLKGDSGSGSIQYDENGNMIITAIASSGIHSIPKGNNYKLQITLPDGTFFSQYVPTSIEGWGDIAKKDLDFDVIKTKLKELKLLTNEKLKEGVTITREYTRHTKNYYADLLHPQNQIFIKEIMNK